ncbi:hypothetical protein KEM60_02012 [Austwickia sp. TVS 96-490-7B]|uniref:hypothetical protein n=1 Tax=Austwickia sp. TVS 96-490-7B TaxID=2830843 RepID=UPI001C5606B3|nr:hypothetical protein [Austwickia sp. TVS 96-490-7B]MBW3085801.1 hypothetical protein [Austwickia sp. TVS 96-490-7B]
MMRHLTRRLTALLIATPLVLTGCSSGDADTPAPGQSSSSSSAPSLTGLKQGQDVDKSTFFGATQAAQSNKTYAFTVQVGQAGALYQATGVADNRDSNDRKRQMTVTRADGKIVQLIIVGGHSYEKAGAGNDGTWNKGQVSGQLEQLLSGSADRIAQDKDVVRSITYAGDEQIDGVTTRRFVLNLMAPTSSATPTVSAQASSAPAASTSATGDTTHQLQYWLDEQNRPRKAVSFIDGQQVTATYSKWDEGVTITAPANAASSAPSASGTATTR